MFACCTELNTEPLLAIALMLCSQGSSSFGQFVCMSLPIDQDVQASQLLDGFLDGSLHVFLLGQVRHDRHPMLQLRCLRPDASFITIAIVHWEHRELREHKEGASVRQEACQEGLPLHQAVLSAFQGPPRRIGWHQKLLQSISRYLPTHLQNQREPIS